MPQSPTNILRRCLPLQLPADISVGILQRVLKYLLPMPQSPTASPSVITVENTDGIIMSIKFLLEKKISARSPVCNTIGVPSVFGFFLFPTKLATEQGILYDQYSDRRILSVKLSVKILPMNSVSSTDGINSSVKLFNGVVFIDFELIIIIYFDLFSKKLL